MTVTGEFISDFCHSATNINIPVEECDALTDLYDATNGDAWMNNMDWYTDVDVCTWYGVTCANFTGQDSVIIVSLPGNNMNGSLPLTLSHISHLTYLDLSDNNLLGQLPSWT